MHYTPFNDANLSLITQFLEMCILSGCDYLSSLPGVGLKTAYALMSRHGSASKARSPA